MDTQQQVKPVKSSAVKGISIADILDLRRKELTLREIGKILGCTEGNVSRRLKEYEPTLVKLDRFKRHRADLLTLKQAEIMESLSPEKIEAASLLQATTAMAVLYDKERLERGQSTANIDIHGEVRQAMERVQALRQAVESEE